jgi:hypothetical protein
MILFFLRILKGQSVLFFHRQILCNKKFTKQTQSLTDTTKGKKNNPQHIHQIALKTTSFNCIGSHSPFSNMKSTFLSIITFAFPNRYIRISEC